MIKDLQERNHLVRWGLLIGVTFFGCATATILFIDYEIIRNPQIVRDHHFQALLFALALYFTVYFTNRFIQLLARYLNQKYMQRFDRLPELSSFKESSARNYFPEKNTIISFCFFTGLPPHLRNFSF